MLSNKSRKTRGTFVARVLENYLPALCVLLIAVVSATYADSQRQTNAEQALRADTNDQLGRFSSAIQQRIQNNVALLQGLVAAIENEPDISQERFADLSARLLKTSSELRNVAAAKDLVVNRLYPVKGYEKLEGFNYRTSKAQAPAALTVEAEGKPVITGPVDLVQGGRGLIIRLPVYVGEPGDKASFWGILSGVVIIEKLFDNSGLVRASDRLDIAVFDKSETNGKDERIFGPEWMATAEPVIRQIDFGHERWTIAAVPKGGWTALPDDMAAFRLLLIAACLLLVLPMIWAGWLTEDRRQHIRQLLDSDDRLRALSHRLEIALQTSGIGVWEFHPASGELFWDTRMRDLYDVDPDQIDCTYADWSGALHPDDLDKATQEFADALAHGQRYTSEFRIVTRDGQTRHVRAIGDTFIDAAGVKKIVGVNWNVTADVDLRQDLEKARLEAEAQNTALEEARGLMEYNALHDTLTGLPNRRFLDQRLADLDRLPSPRQRHAILHVDLDRFKEINDTLGHAAGDAMLRHVANTLNACIDTDDVVARIGGDEFVILAACHGSATEFNKLASAIIESLRAPIFYQGHECRCGVSIGIACQANENEELGQTLVNADIALYEAKRRGRNRFEFFTDTLRAAVINTKQTADEILRGLEQREFITFYQPQFDARSFEITGVEALVRWDHPTRGLLAPASFLHTAETLNVVARIDEIVLEDSLFEFQRWAANDLSIPKVSVNISAQRLRDDTLISRLSDLPFKEGTLCFELLESISFDENDDQLTDNIARIKDLGIDIEIDDFGTGYASIVSLLKLSPKRLKIDRQLIIPILGSQSQQQLVSSIIDIGRARGMEIIAEGVETLAHARILRDLGCHALQGYAFARPMSGKDLVTFVQSRSWMPEMPVKAASRISKA